MWTLFLCNWAFHKGMRKNGEVSGAWKTWHDMATMEKMGEVFGA